MSMDTEEQQGIMAGIAELASSYAEDMQLDLMAIVLIAPDGATFIHERATADLLPVLIEAMVRAAEHFIPADIQ